MKTVISRSQLHKNTNICSKPETYIELYLNFLFAKFIIFAISIGILVVFLTVFYELKPYIELFYFYYVHNEIKTTISDDNNEETGV